MFKLKEEWKEWSQITPNNALYDRTLLLLYFIMITIGFVAVSSASIGLKKADPSFFIIREGSYIALSLILGLVTTNISMESWQKWSQPSGILAWGSILMLILLFIVGKKVNGSIRWIPLGPVNFQPSELAKLAIIAYFSSFFVRKYDEIRNHFFSFWRPAIVVSIFGFLLMCQPDLGSTAVIFALTVAMLFIAGARIPQFILILLGGAFFAYIGVTLASYRVDRVMSFLNPFADVEDTGYQLANSQMAYGRGELTGVGLGNSVQKLEFLPEAHTDFIMAIWGEEFGLIGITLVMAIVILMVSRILKISKESLQLEERYKGFFAFGVAMWIFGQSFVNLGVSSGALPTKGLTFPFVSYGGSSLIMMTVALAIVLRIDYENRVMKAGSALPKSD